MNKITNYIKANKLKVLIHILSLLILRAFWLDIVEILKYGSNVISFNNTIRFYAGITVILSYLIYFIFRKKAKELIASIMVFMVMILGVEAFLKYGVKVRQTYTERKGSKFYQSPYHQRMYIKDKYEDEPLIFTHDPNSIRIESCSEFSYKHEYNSMGIRNDEVGLFKRNDEVRILCLGDSYTEGIGTSQDSTWVKLLEHKLNETGQDRYFNCINGGKSGADPVDAYFIMGELSVYQPDLVLLCINNTETSEIAVRGGFERYQDGKMNLKYGPKWEPLFALSYIFRHIMIDLLNYTFELRTKKQMEAETEKAYDILEAAILHIKEVTDAADVGLGLIIMPTESEILQRKTILDNFVEHLATTTDINIIYPLPCLGRNMFQNGRNTNDFYWKIDRHLNSSGYDILAECIYNKLDIN